MRPPLHTTAGRQGTQAALIGEPTATAARTKERRADGHHALHLADQLHGVHNGGAVNNDGRARHCQACTQRQKGDKV